MCQNALLAGLTVNPDRCLRRLPPGYLGDGQGGEHERGRGRGRGRGREPSERQQHPSRRREDQQQPQSDPRYRRRRHFWFCRLMGGAVKPGTLASDIEPRVRGALPGGTCVAVYAKKRPGDRVARDDWAAGPKNWLGFFALAGLDESQLQSDYDAWRAREAEGTAYDTRP